MALVPGTRLGAYEIVGLIGAGGMGEVFRARDKRLDRQVAIKSLPDGLHANSERAARFEREAKLLATLNHPNIATIHGLEEANGDQFIVMELVEGETLADRIAQGPVTNYSIRVQSLESDRQDRPLIQNAEETYINADLSPDGRWLAYQRSYTRLRTQSDIVVQPFPNVEGGKWTVSRGGSKPLWSHSGRELFFLTKDYTHIAKVTVDTGASFKFGREEPVLDIRRFVTHFADDSDPGRSYDVSLDDQRFLMIASANDAPSQIVVVDHWLQELTRQR